MENQRSQRNPEHAARAKARNILPETLNYIMRLEQNPKLVAQAAASGFALSTQHTKNRLQTLKAATSKNYACEPGKSGFRGVTAKWKKSGEQS
jgi:hypothetical protein